MDAKPDLVKKSACFFCHENCGVLAHVRNGEVVSIEGDPDHPLNKGALCARGVSALQHLRHPARVNYPLKRVGERGQGQWQRISWEHAWDEIANRLETIRRETGAEAVCSTGGTNRTDDWPRRRFMNLFGSPNVFHTSHVCWIPTFMIETAIYGWCAFDLDLPNSKCVVLWGHNPAASYLPEMRGLFDLREQNDLKIIVIDPRFTETAAKADLWLPLRPGTDAALALAWLNVIIEQDLYDHHFVENCCVGFEELREHVKPYTPEWAAPITWLSAELIQQGARLYATRRPGNLQWGVAVDQLGPAGGAAMHARALLRAVTGNLDAPGSDLLCGPNPTLITDEEMECNEWLPEEQRAKQIGSDRYKLVAWPGYAKIASLARKTWGKAPPAEWMCEAHGPSVFEALVTGKPYRPRALLVLANNPISAYPDSKRVSEALHKTELLTVMDYWLTPTAMLADYVLPAAGALERPIITSTYGCTDFVITSQRAIPPLYERRTDYEFWRGLALRLGQAEQWPWDDLEEVNYYRVYPLGYAVNSYDEFVEQVRFVFPAREYYKYGRLGFATPSGRVELVSQTLQELGYDALPRFVGPAEQEDNPELAGYPLVLVAGGGSMPFFHSEHRQLKHLRYLRHQPCLQIHPETANKYGIAQGDWVWVETRRGKIRQRADLTTAVHPRVVYVERGWWFPEQEGTEPEHYGILQSNANVLTGATPDLCDPMSGSWANRGLLCRVSKMNGAIGGR